MRSARKALLALPLALFLHGAAPAHAEGSTSSAKVHPVSYFVGGLFGIVPGFGTGHRTASVESDTHLHWALAPRSSGVGFGMPTDPGLSLALSKRF